MVDSPLQPECYVALPGYKCLTPCCVQALKPLIVCTKDGDVLETDGLICSAGHTCLRDPKRIPVYQWVEG